MTGDCADDGQTRIGRSPRLTQRGILSSSIAGTQRHTVPWLTAKLSGPSPNTAPTTSWSAKTKRRIGPTLHTSTPCPRARVSIQADNDVSRRSSRRRSEAADLEPFTGSLHELRRSRNADPAEEQPGWRAEARAGPPQKVRAEERRYGAGRCPGVVQRIVDVTVGHRIRAWRRPWRTGVIGQSVQVRHRRIRQFLVAPYASQADRPRPRTHRQYRSAARITPVGDEHRHSRGRRRDGRTDYGRTRPNTQDVHLRIERLHYALTTRGCTA